MCNNIHVFFAGLLSGLTVLVLFVTFMFLFSLYVRKNAQRLVDAQEELKALQVHNMDLLHMMSDVDDRVVVQSFQISTCRKQLEEAKELLFQRQEHHRLRMEIAGTSAAKKDRKSTLPTESGILPSHCYLIPDAKISTEEDVYV